MCISADLHVVLLCLFSVRKKPWLLSKVDQTRSALFPLLDVLDRRVPLHDASRGTGTPMLLLRTVHGMQALHAVVAHAPPSLVVRWNLFLVWMSTMNFFSGPGATGMVQRANVPLLGAGLPAPTEARCLPGEIVAA